MYELIINLSLAYENENKKYTRTDEQAKRDT